jgi:hypothetical protein
MKFIFGDNHGTPRPDKSIIFKEHIGNTHHVIEVDTSSVAKQLGISEEETIPAIRAVVTSIWRLVKWEVDKGV